MTASAWSSTEVSLILADYFEMLEKELRGEKYNKSAYRRALLQRLPLREKGAVEFKHQNISAVLANLGQPYIKGYLPRFSYQHLLEEKVIEQLTSNPALESLFRNFADKQVQQPKITDYSKFKENAPDPEAVREPQPAYGRKAVKVNYLKREQQNKQLGDLGEEMVVEYEKWNLKREGKSRYAAQVRWVAREEGDGLGYDVLSKDLAGNDKFIEVKTTKLTKKTPIYFSKNELDFSINHQDKFYLYRLFDFEKEARMFILRGALNQICQAQAINFKGYF